ncbi:hypothetical protein AK812_SmicGene38454 [Symbiodinium microadriaticum]|uniref:Uncharacterized protein n=1 Tax=Symbiodinium microadriaticum TaxID=2951 RepID=A0A1Q9CDQ5_SYMMI|nr:hypothetical protein AK812_SmicGene38454 [Symbiodinium microadriaticum]
MRLTAEPMVAAAKVRGALAAVAQGASTESNAGNWAAQRRHADFALRSLGAQEMLDDQFFRSAALGAAEATRNRCEGLTTMVKRRAVRASLLGVAVALPALAYLGRAFLVAPPAGAVQRAAPTHQGEGHFATQNGIETSAVALPALGCLAAAAAARLLMRRPAAPSTQLVPLAGGALTCYEEADAPAVVMHSDGGRRKRLGIPGKICMLTGTYLIFSVILKPILGSFVPKVGSGIARQLVVDEML